MEPAYGSVLAADPYAAYEGERHSRQPRGVRGEGAERDRLARASALEAFGERRVERDLPAHDGVGEQQSCHRLRDRAELEHRGRVDRPGGDDLRHAFAPVREHQPGRGCRRMPPREVGDVRRQRYSTTVKAGASPVSSGTGSTGTVSSGTGSTGTVSAGTVSAGTVSSGTVSSGTVSSGVGVTGAGGT